MKLYKFTCGVDEKVGVFADETEAYERRTEVDPTFHFLPVTIEEIEIPGYKVYPSVELRQEDMVFQPTRLSDGEIDAMDRKQLTEWLKANNVDYVPQWGDARLRETVKSHNPSVAVSEKADAEKIARICHEVNRGYCRSIGDDSQPSWEEAPEWQKESVVNGVNFHLENETTPEQSHENWMAEKVAAGWVYGPIKDPEKKEHPCMVAYQELPAEQRTKDYLFKAVVDTFKEAKQ